MLNYEDINVQQEISETDSFTEDRYKQLYRYFPSDVRSVLDIGCNTGRGGKTLKLLNQQLQIYGLDCVQDRLSKLPPDAYVKGIYGLSTSIPCKDCEFDVVVAGEFIEHLYPNDVDKSLTEIFRVLKIGGRLLLTTPNPTGIRWKVRKESCLGGAHLSQHFYDTLKLKLRMFGFSRLKVLGSGRMTRYLGDKVPLIQLYGSYLLMGDKY